MGKTESVNAIHFYMHDNMDEIFDEKGNTFLAMRKIQWCKPDAEPDPDKAKLELRKWHMKSEGETPGKGFSFLTEEGPHELTDVLISNGYGHTKDILELLRDRDDFEESVKAIYGSDKDDDEYFDPREALLY